MKNDYIWIGIILFLIFTTEPTSTLGIIGKFLAGLGIFLYFTASALRMFKKRDRQ